MRHVVTFASWLFAALLFAWAAGAALEAYMVVPR